MLDDLLTQKPFWKTACLRITLSTLWISGIFIDPDLLTLEKCPEPSINKIPCVKITVFLFTKAQPPGTTAISYWFDTNTISGKKFI